MKEQSLNKFAILPSYYEALHQLPLDQQDKVFGAIIRYGVAGVEPQFDNDLMAIIFDLIRPNIDSSVRHFQKQKANGQSGGRPSETQGEPAVESAKNPTPHVGLQGEKTQSTPTANQTVTQSKPSENRESHSHLSLSPSQRGGVGEEAKKFTQLSDIGETEITQLAHDYRCSPALVRNCLDDLKNYCASKGKTYKNYLAALRNFVKSDLNRGAKNASQLTTPSLFQKTADNPDLARQVRQLSQAPRAPASDEEIRSLRAAMPEFLQAKLAARDSAEGNSA